MPRTTVTRLLEEARSRIRRHDPVQARAAIDEGALLIDIRCEEDRLREGTVTGSIHIPRTVLEWRADPESEWRDERVARLETTLILMCNDGYSSSLAAASLAEIGFENVGDLIGGFRAWRAAGLPTV
jgi:rhodanese-related sulfurtransferase